MCARKSFQLPRILCLELLGCDLEFEPSWSWALEVFRVLHVQFIGDAPCLQQFTTKNNHISVFALCHHADDMLDSSNKGTCSVSRAFLNLSASHLQVTNPEGLEKAASAARVKPPFCEVFVCGSWLFEYAWIFRVGPLNACQGGQEIPHWHNYKCCIILQRPVILPQREWELGGRLVVWLPNLFLRNITIKKKFLHWLHVNNSHLISKWYWLFLSLGV